MKNLILITLALIISMNTLFAQDETRKVSKLGVMYWKPMQIELPENHSLKMSIPPITLDYEREILPILSLATETGFMKIDLMHSESHATQTGSFQSGQAIANMYGLFASVGLTGHIRIKNTFEPYIKGSYGYLSMLATTQDDFIQKGAFYRSFSAGLNLYLSDRFGVFGEMGLKDSAGTFKVGLVFRK